MKMKRLNRNEAIKLAGVNAVEKAEGSQVEFTNRVSADLDCDGLVEFSSTESVEIEVDGETKNLTMYVYVSKEELAECQELDMINWDKAVENAEFEIE